MLFFVMFSEDYSKDERLTLYAILCSRSKIDIQQDKVFIKFHDIRGRTGSDIQNVNIPKDKYESFIDKMKTKGILRSANESLVFAGDVNEGSALCDISLRAENESLVFADDVHEGSVICDILLRAENVKERLNWLFEYLSETVCQKFFRFIKGIGNENRPCIYLPSAYCCVFLDKIIRRRITENNQGLFRSFSVLK